MASRVLPRTTDTHYQPSVADLDYVIFSVERNSGREAEYVTVRRYPLCQLDPQKWRDKELEWDPASFTRGEIPNRVIAGQTAYGYEDTSTYGFYQRTNLFKKDGDLFRIDLNYPAEEVPDTDLEFLSILDGTT